MSHIHHTTFRSSLKWTRSILLAKTPRKSWNLKIKIYNDVIADPDIVLPKRYWSKTIKS